MPKSAKGRERRTDQDRSEGEASKPKWTPSEKERAVLDAYFARVRAGAAVAPRIKISAGENVTKVSLDHPDQAIGTALLAEAFGTTNFTMANELIEQLMGASLKDGKYDEQRANFMVALIQGIKPRDELEAMLAAQMAAVHVATMTFARRLAGVETIQQQDSAERAFNKLSRTFTTQMEALKRYRSGGEQKVTVQHIDVRGGQAIVGDVSQSNRAAAPAASAESPSALTHSKQTPMPIVSEPYRSAVAAKRK